MSNIFDQAEKLPAGTMIDFRPRPSAEEVFVMGLDLGQASDSTAIAIAQRVNDQPNGPPAIHLRHLERVALGMPYPKIVEKVAAMLAAPELRGRTELVVDATGVGRPVVDMLRAAGLSPLAVTITGGTSESRDGADWRVPKRDLVVGVQVLLQEGRLKIPRALAEGETLRRELLAFRVKIDSVTAHDTYNAREGAHDDLVLAAALACWRLKDSGFAFSI